MKGLTLAIQYLTSFKIGNYVEFNKENIKSALYFFPLVGLFIGILTVIPIFLVETRIISSFLCLFIYILSTGGVHLDGVADVGDLKASCVKGERAFEILKDSRIGAMGVLSLVINILARLCAYYYLIDYPHIIILGAVVGRFTALVLVNSFSPNQHSSMARSLYNARPGPSLRLYLGLWILGLAYFERLAIFGWILALAYNYWSAKGWDRKLGGISGDFLGRATELGDLISLYGFILIMEVKVLL